MVWYVGTEAQMNDYGNQTLPLSLIETQIVQEFEQLSSLDEKYSRLFELGEALASLFLDSGAIFEPTSKQAYHNGAYRVSGGAGNSRE